MGDGLQIIGLGMCTLDVLIRCKDLPTWEGGTRISAFGFDGGGPVGTAMVAAAKLGARVGFIGTAGNDAAAAPDLPGREVEPPDRGNAVCGHARRLACGEVERPFRVPEMVGRRACGQIFGHVMVAGQDIGDRQQIGQGDRLQEEGGQEQRRCGRHREHQRA